jgi:hypothetical protein
LFSFANKKLGDDIEANKCISFELGALPRFCTYAAMLLMMANRAGYMASSFPLLVVSRVYMDCLSLALVVDSAG